MRLRTPRYHPTVIRPTGSAPHSRTTPSCSAMTTRSLERTLLDLARARAPPLIYDPLVLQYFNTEVFMYGDLLNFQLQQGHYVSGRCTGYGQPSITESELATTLEKLADAEVKTKQRYLEIAEARMDSPWDAHSGSGFRRLFVESSGESVGGKSAS